LTELVNDKDFVLPGQPLTDEKEKAGRFTYVHGGLVRSAVAGMVRMRGQKAEVIPARGPYKPRENDRVIGIVVDIKPSYYELDLGWGITGILKAKRAKKPGKESQITIGDVIYTSIAFAGVKGVMLKGGKDAHKITRGFIVTMSPTRVPRLIVRNRELQETIERESNCKLYIGLNGYIAVVGPSTRNEFAAASAIKLVETEPTLEGLKEKVMGLLRRELWEEMVEE
jgi:RNA-binding protein Rrp4 and related proteins (contain S1 domain and KH domain)